MTNLRGGRGFHRGPNAVITQNEEFDRQLREANFSERFIPTRLVTGNYTATVWDLVICDPSGGEFTITIPAAKTVKAGDAIVVKNVTNSVTAITIKARMGLIDNLTSVVINNSRASNKLIAAPLKNSWYVV
jgi:hypothetical protein